MLQLLIEREEINECQQLLKQRIREILSSPKEMSVGYPGGSEETDIYFSDKKSEKLWSGMEDGHKRYWNIFGLKPIKKSGSQNIELEINIPHNDVNRSVGGGFVRDTDTGEVSLIHRGHIIGGKSAFLKWYRVKYEGEFIHFNDKERINSAILISSLKNVKLVSHITNLVDRVNTYKTTQRSK